MRTTFDIDDSIMFCLKQEAANQGRTMSELIDDALRLWFSSQEETPDLPTLPTFNSGGHLVDIADRDALHEEMDGD